MKTWMEIAGWATVGLGLLLKIFMVIAGSFVLIVSASSLALFYSVYCFYAFKRKDIEIVSKVSLSLFRAGVAVASIAILFTAQFWPGANLMQQTALFLFLANLVLSLSWMLRNASTGKAETKKFMRKSVRKSLALAIVLAFILLMKPSDIKLVLGGWRFSPDTKTLMRDCLDEGRNCDAYYASQSNANSETHDHSGSPNHD